MAHKPLKYEIKLTEILEVEENRVLFGGIDQDGRKVSLHVHQPGADLMQEKLFEHGFVIAEIEY